MEKSAIQETLPLAAHPVGSTTTTSDKPRSRKWRVIAYSAIISVILWAHLHNSPLFRTRHTWPAPTPVYSGCEQVDPLKPTLQGGDLKDIDTHLASSHFRNASILRLSKIVQIPSISYDDMGSVEEDERFQIFYEIEKYLESTFPLVHKNLKKENVNTHGLLYTWAGSNDKLKPTVLMAHQDVVPVEKSTVDTWTHPPFSGFYDGKYIWGRGSSDCKNNLIAILESVETLLEAGFQPARTVLLSFGFDEEVSGPRGAGTLAPYILERYGKNSVAAVIDEGNGFASRWGDLYALPGVGEKGYTDVHVVVRMPGGHSSVPSPHTSIGVVSQLVNLIEAETYKPWLSNDNPYLGVLQCGAKYSESFPKKLKHLLARRGKKQDTSPNTSGCSGKKHVDPLAEAAAEQDPFTRYLMQTSQAVDLITGGAKVNALPERVEAVVNHRINIGEHPSLVQRRIAHLAAKVAKHHNLTLYAFPGSEEKIKGNSITLTASPQSMEPAPSTPLDINVPGTNHLSPWGVLSGTTRAIYGEEVKMAPGSMTGNTDTRYFWDLSKHIFRYNPGFDPEEPLGFGNIHTVDEKQSVVAHINSVKWFTTWIRNADEAHFE
ncbi:carboxypeptidase S [Myriangium duriaei CBS 260.36]|uniref:Carboxypeptidase S n=1 Tax=Myriangium duriaei CBS 260.36 TaxID=1168546 RepID=A0A9P4MD03_9PEZI|nr:carboxypeptidase S [Myriangium duriaei CBS 260.36]